ncbi:hypothetical protein [Poseidonibacter ostreae]|uniref:Uncharacterized protein n=1 Tax=Poseidonibacter ostreae TaxID=2654171 RepID=A0A6L4WUC3_9BACT|nr:hypothetical protein [Poseidonibacter ostreae]KAB7884998.1 hypothetical protein GA417_09735 [Poseidonibacter ostreae]KAB7888990.1 hypothetical protein GBG19_07315 [Poseidonibacter ostreae]KAB7891923.1 hypothetical protein GBG18_04865 [Poseidonibacter ostreae]
MLDLQYYTKHALNEEDAALFLKHFKNDKYNSLYAFIKQLENMDNKLSWINKQEYKIKLLELCNRFKLGLEPLVIPINQKIEFLESQINIGIDFPEFQWKNNAHGGICPSCGKKELFVPNHGESNFIKCSRENKCGYKSSIYNYLRKEKGLQTIDALLELAKRIGIDFDLYQKSLEVHLDTEQINFKVPKKVSSTVTTNNEVTYTKFDVNKKYTEVNFSKTLELYSNMNEKQKFMMIVTSIYEYSLTSNQKKKIKYYKSRGISALTYTKLLSKVNLINTKVGYLSIDDLENLINHLKEIYSTEDLIHFGVINDDNHKYPHSFKHYSEEGFCVIPSFDLYSNMVTGLKLRNTKLAQWQSKNLKEPELSFSRIASPLPFGLTREVLQSKNSIIRLQEGSIDSFSLPIMHNTYDVSIAGVNGMRIEDYGLFENKEIEIWFDQDYAGQKSAYGIKTLNVSLSSTELSHYSLLMKYQDLNDSNITSSKVGDITNIKIQFINSDIYLDEFNKHLNLFKDKNINYDISISKGIKDLILDAGAKNVSVKTWDIELGSDINEVLQKNNIEKITTPSIG